MMSAIKSQFGGADICINNAGLAHNAPLLSGSTEMWRQMLEVCTQYCINYQPTNLIRTTHCKQSECKSCQPKIQTYTSLGGPV